MQTGTFVHPCARHTVTAAWQYYSVTVVGVGDKIHFLCEQNKPFKLDGSPSDTAVLCIYCCPRVQKLQKETQNTDSVKFATQIHHLLWMN